MKKEQTSSDFLFGAAKNLKTRKEKIRKANVRRQWLADHIIDVLALIVAVIALIRTF